MEGLPKNVDLLKGLDLFSGIGGIGLALKPWVRTVAYCERDRYAQGVLLSRMRAGDIDLAPIWDDVCTLRKEHLPKIDIIFGGFPCQDISVAGTGKGLAGERSGLFFEVVRLAGELRPSFLFLENVPALSVRGLDRVLLELTSLGYDCRWTIVSAAEVGAPHLRERIWIAAYCDSERGRIQPEPRTKCEGAANAEHFGQAGGGANLSHGSTSLANAHGSGRIKQREPFTDEKEDKGVKRGGEVSEPWRRRCEERRGTPDGGGAGSQRKPDHAFAPSWWATEPNVDRVVNGLPPELDFFIYGSEELDVSSIESDTSQEVTEAYLFNREILRKMWEFREIAATSPELYFGKLHDSLPTLPRRPAHFRENLGQRIQEGSELFDLWSSFYSETEQEQQPLWQRELLKRIRQISGEETMAKANRVDRIRCLGNSVVPIAARTAFARLIGIGG